VLALSAALAGCGGSSSGATTVASEDTAEIVVGDARFSASVARRVWVGFVDALRQGRYAAAAGLWPDELQTIPRLPYAGRAGTGPRRDPPGRPVLG
jgi:hypothetical protein